MSDPGHQHAARFRRRLRPTLGLKFLVAGASVLMCLVVAELGLRARRMALIRRDPFWGASVTIHRKSEDPGLVYELTPGSRASRDGAEIIINPEGFRDDPFPDPPPDGARRIVVLGDSVAFGWGVAMESAFPQRLEALLQREGPTVVYNLAVDGYSTKQEIRMLESRGLPLGPDLVVIAYVLNDPDNRYDAGLNRYFQEPGIELARPFSDALWNLRHGPDLATLAGRANQDYSRYVHERYRGGIEKDFARLGAIARKSGVPVVVAIVPVFDFKPGLPYPWQDLHDDLKLLAEANGLACVDLAEAFTGRDSADVSLDLWHPNAEGHRVIAERLAKIAGPEEIQQMTRQPRHVDQ